jgi:hypothetical protein
MKRAFFIAIVLLCGYRYSHAQDNPCVEGNCETGHGTYIYAGGEKYVGDFVDGKRQGQGELTKTDGETYTGGWLNDVFSGQGTYIWSNGAKYIGEWKEGVRDGYGVYFFPNGDKYNGYFKNNMFHGKGTYIWEDGSSQTGMYENNVMVSVLK